MMARYGYVIVDSTRARTHWLFYAIMEKRGIDIVLWSSGGIWMNVSIRGFPQT